MENLFFAASLPRSGSTLLLNILGQNPNHHVTPTSGLIELFFQIKKNWKSYIEFKAEGLENAKPRVLGAMKGILHGFFEEELKDGKVVFDKSRGWLQYIEDLEEVLGKKVKVIVSIRDIRSILASFEKIYQNRGIDYDYAAGDDFYKCQTVEGRSQCLLDPKSVLGLTINRLRDALNRKIKDRLVIVPYGALVKQPKETLEILHAVLGLPPFEYNFDKVKQITKENDLWHGMDLHKIRSKVEYKEGNPWEGLISENFCDRISQEYKDIQKLTGNVL